MLLHKLEAFVKSKIQLDIHGKAAQKSLLCLSRVATQGFLLSMHSTNNADSYWDANFDMYEGSSLERTVLLVCIVQLNVLICSIFGYIVVQIMRIS
jgi:hypothetical protein